MLTGWLVPDSTATTDVIRELARAPELAVVMDLDGTLIPFAATPSEARLDATAIELVALLGQCPGTHLAVVSGRVKEQLEGLFPDPHHPLLVAEHGAWRRREGTWTCLDVRGAPPHEVERSLREISLAHPGSLVEHKTWSVSLHYRGVASSDREGTYVEAVLAIEGWLKAHPEYEVLEGHLVIEVRHRAANKGSAIGWLRESLPSGVRIVALGDDLTDEDTFAALAVSDVAIAIGPNERPTRAHARASSVADAREFLRWLAQARRPGQAGAVVGPVPGVRPTVHGGTGMNAPLLVASNRLPSEEGAEAGRHRTVGGLVSGVSAALSARGGVWLGWSGRAHDGERPLAVDERTIPGRASFDLHPEAQSLYYNGFANRTLWPILHGFIGRARFREAEWAAYVDVNDLFADHAARIARRDALVWVHDYHLLLLAQALRTRGHRGPIGHFLHVPFPALEAFETIPRARDVLDAMLAFDLLGFHTHRHAENFIRAAVELGGATKTQRGVARGGRWAQVGVFPLGIDATQFQPQADDDADPEIAVLRAAFEQKKLVLAVDRLDYTKGIVERLDAFARMFELFPEWIGRVSLLQVAVPSRADVPEYAEQRRAVENAVGRINGELGEAHWTPVRYVCRSYGRAALARLYRAADVGVVTPLRDGMNLVAKEYVAAQDPLDPGVLVLSQFAGAADELDAAVLTNPYDRGGSARAIVYALTSTREERVARHGRLLDAVKRNTPPEWAYAFLSALAATR